MNKSTVIPVVILAILGIFFFICCICIGFPIVLTAFNTSSAEKTTINSQIEITSTEEVELFVTTTSISTKDIVSTRTNLATSTPFSIPSNTSTPKPTLEEPSSTVTPSIEPLVNIDSILGKSVNEVEYIIGASTLITPNDDFDDNLSGGEYRDYILGDYTVFIAYDKTGIARVFQILDGLSEENYSLDDWKIILPKFGLNLTMKPSREAPAAYYWDNYQGNFIALIASNSKGQPVWSVQIAQKGYQP